MAAESKYIREKQVEKKGKMKWDKYQLRSLKLTKECILEYWTVSSSIDEKSQLKGCIDLMIEGLNEVKQNKNKGQIYKFGWQMQTDGRIYYFTSSNDRERKNWIKQIQDTYQQVKNSKKGKNDENQQSNKTKKSWGSALKNFKETAKSGGVGSAMQALKKDAHDLKKQKFRAKKERKKVIATLDTSSIFGCYNNAKNDDHHDNKELFMDYKQESKSNDDDDDHENNKHPLMMATLNELLHPNVHTFSSKLGVKASRFNNITSFNDDLIASNEFCQIAIGKGLLRNYLKDGETSDNNNDNNDDNDDDNKESSQLLKINRRPADDISDDEEIESKDNKNIPIPQLRHDGTLREKINFRPGHKDFTICCEIFCEDVTGGNTILSNRIEDRGFEFIAPRPGSRRMSVWMEGNKLLNVGQTELFQQIWYHIAIVCKRANIGKNSKLQKTESVFNVNKNNENENENENDKDDIKRKREKFKIKNLKNMSGKEMIEQMTGKAKITSEATDFAVFLNGVIDGKLSLDGAPTLDTLNCRIGSNVDMTMTSCFNGKLKNFEIFDRALNEEEIYLIAHKKTNYSLKKPVLLSYIPESLKVEIPIYNIKYNGPIHCLLPSHLQWQPGLNSFTISAWIMCSRNVSKMGSVILSNLTTSNNGFELICPTVNNQVIGIKKTGYNKNDNEGMQIGTTIIEKNKFYHISIVIDRVITYGSIPDNTSIVVYVNGKQDGSYNINTILNYSGGDWTIGYNGHYKSDTRFEGSISNLRIFQRPLIEAEIATIYAADLRERNFIENEDIYYCTVKQESEQEDNNNNIISSNQHLTYFDDLKWEKGIFINMDLNEGKVKLLDKSKNETTMTISKIIKTNDKISQFVPGLDSQKINNLGGMIHGITFKGEKWRIYSEQTEFLRHITKMGIFTLLSKLKPFTKYEFEQMIENKYIDNKYLLNRLLFSSHKLLKNVNEDKKLWPYFNDYILPWKLWKNNKNFKLLQEVARNLQFKYKKQQFDLYEKLKKENPNCKIFKIQHEQHKTIKNRQDGFDGGLNVEFDENLISKQLSLNYDKQVSSMILYGRCTLLNDKFQNCIKQMFNDGTNKFYFKSAPQKTYERMVEKTIEYQSENAKFPAAYRVCDVLRCSITCNNLNHICDGLNILRDNIIIIRIKNRFLISFDSKQTDGYRDMLVNVLYKDEITKLSVICEVQFQLNAYLQIKKKQHKYYKIVRAIDYKSLLRNYEARKFD